MYDPKKIENAVLALLGAFEFDHGRAWKRYDFDVMDALAEQGFISDPRRGTESVALSETGLARAKLLAQQLFGA